MTSTDVIILEQILDQKKAELAPSLSAEGFFEIFAAQQLLKDEDLSYDEIKSGLVGGPGDGGIDAIYIFANGELVQEDTDLSHLKKGFVLDVVVVQSKSSSGFSETAIDKLTAASADLFDLGRSLDTLNTVYNSRLRAAAALFRQVYQKQAAKFPTLGFRYYYATKGDTPHPNVERKVEKLHQTITGIFSAAKVECEFVGANKLLELARRGPRSTYTLRLAETPISSKDAFVCLGAQLLPIPEFDQPGTWNGGFAQLPYPDTGHSRSMNGVRHRSGKRHISMLAFAGGGISCSASRSDSMA